MKKAIGGLLVVSLLTSPHPIDLNYMAYLALKNQNKVMYVQFINDEDTEAKPGDIDQAMAGMEENSRTITSLLKERSAALTKLEAKMDLLSHAGVTLNGEQMTNYAEFMSKYHEDAIEFNGLLKSMEGAKNLNIVQKEILNEDTDYNLVIDQLNRIIDTQHLAIDNLSRTVLEGETLLEML